jgi:hypothetical protein
MLAMLVVLIVASGGAVTLARHDLSSSPSTPATRPRQAEPSAAGSVTPGRVVHLVRSDGTTTFLPLPSPRAGRTLSAQSAYNALVGERSKLSPIPATVGAHYGVLTDASTSPPEAGVRVWGFTVEAGCRPSPGRKSTCRQWEFVDARTGRPLRGVERQVLGGPA